MLLVLASDMSENSEECHPRPNLWLNTWVMKNSWICVIICSHSVFCSGNVVTLKPVTMRTEDAWRGLMPPHQHDGYRSPAWRTFQQTHCAPQLDKGERKQSESANKTPPRYRPTRRRSLSAPLQDSSSFYGFFVVADAICHTVCRVSVHITCPCFFTFLFLFPSMYASCIFSPQFPRKKSFLARLSLWRQICS